MATSAPAGDFASAPEYVIGTAGHVDHGKSALVLALTGTDPDRWQEEKDRGLTIDLGFAHFRLPSGAEASIVDVPGHERFIKNMLAGVGGIDLALLVVAADEGVMPQTREHMAIIDLLGVPTGVVALTKADLADQETLAIADEEARSLIAGTSLEGSPVVPCSAITGQGLDDLVRAIDAALARTLPRRDIGRPRLPIDRAFTMTGFGTVVTGTLTDGRLEVGQEVEILPAGTGARIRGLEHHGRKVEVAGPGRRTAVNLAGIPVEELGRGMVLAARGQVKPVRVLDARIRVVPHIERAVRHNLRVTLHTGAAEVQGRLLLLENDDLAPGESGWAQIRLSAPLAAIRGDRFILRDPNDTLAGGEIVAVDAPRHRRFHAASIDSLERQREGSPADRLIEHLGSGGPVEVQAALVAAGLGPDDAEAAIPDLVARSLLVLLEGPKDGRQMVCSAAGLTELREKVTGLLRGYHQRSPLRPGMAREELRNRLGLDQAAFDAVLRRLAGDGWIADGVYVALPDHRPALSVQERSEADAFIRALVATPYAPSTEHSVTPDVLSYLVSQGKVVDVAGVVFARGAYDDAAGQITERLRRDGEITLAEVRDMLGTTRKYAQALLEHLDAQRITRRTGDVRVLHKPDSGRPA